ncbi:MAG: hypothetical protein AMXMBFR64_26180 [Myxococcales bacterium]
MQQPSPALSDPPEPTGPPAEPPDLSDLAVRMARLFPSGLETLEVLRGVGLDLRHVPPSARPGALLAVWQAAVAAADAQGRLPALLDAARQRYGHERAIVARDPTEPVRTFFLPLALLGVSLGVAVALASFLASIDSRRWTRMDTITLDFADLEIRARFKTVPPPPWAFWLPQPHVTETAPAAAPVHAMALPEVAPVSAPTTPGAPARSWLDASPRAAHGATPAAPGLVDSARDAPSLDGGRAGRGEPVVVPGIPPFDATALPTRPELARPLLRSP